MMILGDATLFPQTLLPLRIFEPRYRQMLAQALASHRMFAVAMQKPGNTRESPLPVAGLGLIRVAVRNRDGTSHIILEGLTRVQLAETVRYKPYRIQRMRPLPSPPCDSVAADALLAKVRELLRERVERGGPLAPPGLLPPELDDTAQTPQGLAKKVLNCLDSIEDPEQAVDLVTCAALPRAAERQVILETIDVETRLRRLIQFLLADQQRLRKGKNHE